MKGFILSIALLSSPAFAQAPNCGPDEKYSSRQDLGVGISMFREPGIWFEGNHTHIFGEWSDDDAICRYLGMKKSVSSSKNRVMTSGLAHIVTLDNNDQWIIRQSNTYEVVVTAIHCK
jgi:hypothetical protein